MLPKVRPPIRPRTRPAALAAALVALGLCLWIAQRFLLQERCVLILTILIDRVSIAGWVALTLLAALSAGCGVLRWVGLAPRRPGAWALFGTGAGLGLISILTLLLGRVGLCHKVNLVIMLVGLLALGLREVGDLLRGMVRALPRARRASAFRVALWCVLGLFLVLNLTRAFEPPWEYDSLEYHLAAPAKYHRAGRVYFLRRNVYANFPQNVEMLYFLAMQVTGSPERGAQVGMMLGGAMGFLAALAVGGMVAGLAGREAGDLAAAMFYTWPGVTVYSGVAYVELALIFYGTLALWGVVWSWRRRRTAPGGRGWVWLAGLAAGLALGVKYTAALLVVVPCLVWLLVIGRPFLRGGFFRPEALRRAGCFAGMALLAFGPWMVRNFANTRNPVYPLLYRAFDGRNWSPEKDARWTQAHAPKFSFLRRQAEGPDPAAVGHPQTAAPSAGAGRKGRKPWRLVRELGAQAREAVVFDERKASLPVLLFIPLVLLAGRRTRGVVALLLGHQVLLFLLWFFFTQRNVRFLEVWMPSMAALSALGVAAVASSPRAAGLRPLIVVLLLVGPSRWVNYLNVQRSLGVALGAVSPREFFAGPAQVDFKVGYAAMQFINDPAQVPPDAKVLFLGEARTFYCRRDHLAATVFDDQPIEEVLTGAQTPQEVRDRFRRHGITHLYVDTRELARLQESYRYVFQGRERLGMLDGFDWDLFGRFAGQYLEPVATFLGRGAQGFPWSEWDRLRERAAAGDRAARLVALYAVR